MRCGWPAVVTLTTRDQYGEIVHVPNLKVNPNPGALVVDLKKINILEHSRTICETITPLLKAAVLHL